MIDREAGRLGTLRNIKPEELELMLVWRNAPSVRNNMYTRHEISLPEHLAWWDHVKERSDQLYFMYERQGVPLGIVALNGIDSVNKNSSWAFYAAPEAPKGTGSRMGFLALEHAFYSLLLHKLCGEALSFNAASINFHQKLGFKVEGILREQHWLDGAFTDVYRMGLLAHEWQEIRTEMLSRLLKLSNT
ncbi:MAG: UDP-4-amino-4,6-dideoxy-N-acetyl-beta-L-altrosamine N-acetyltransferase [Hydrogenophaga sp.]|nr:UDP-4-amino-4,6-dideoxy-N-acetyl-beta-L-altrosamine N-acetyltransferase [Hydrogenophaga sp.]